MCISVWILVMEKGRRRRQIVAL